MEESLKTPGAGRIVGKSASWMHKARIKGDGPPYYQVGRSVIYRRSDLEAWLAQHRRLSTSGKEA